MTAEATTNVQDYFYTDSLTHEVVGYKSEKNYYVTGYMASDSIDLAREIIPASEMDSLVEQMKSGKVKLDIDHSQYRNPDPEGEIPIGRIIDGKKVVEDGKTKVWIKAILNKTHKRFNEVWNGIQEGFLDGFSIAWKGFAKEITAPDGMPAKMLTGVQARNVAITGVPVNADCSMMSSFLKSLGATMEEDGLKAKYIRRTGSPGNYKYFYNEEKKDSGKGGPRTLDEAKESLHNEWVSLQNDLVGKMSEMSPAERKKAAQDLVDAYNEAEQQLEKKYLTKESKNSKQKEPTTDSVDKAVMEDFENSWKEVKKDDNEIDLAQEYLDTMPAEERKKEIDSMREALKEMDPEWDGPDSEIEELVVESLAEQEGADNLVNFLWDLKPDSEKKEEALEFSKEISESFKGTKSDSSLQDEEPEGDIMADENNTKKAAPAAKASGLKSLVDGLKNVQEAIASQAETIKTQAEEINGLKSQVQQLEAENKKVNDLLEKPVLKGLMDSGVKSQEEKATTAPTVGTLHLI